MSSVFKIKLIDGFLYQAVSRWLRMPILSTENCYMLQACLKVLSEMVHVNGFAWKLLDDFGFMGHLEKGGELVKEGIEKKKTPLMHKLCAFRCLFYFIFLFQ